jgi:hypothetical protein
VTDARHALLGELIDHAPLFPPASLPLEEALEDHRRARESPHAWMVRRFVAPASRLGGLDGQHWPLAVVMDTPLEPPLRYVQAVEGRNREWLSGLALEAYLEVPPGEIERLDELIEPIDIDAKVRCGGESVPSNEELGGFVRACRDRGIRFKATAGLHHAVRTEPDHGFLNLLAAVVFGDEEDALAEDDEAAFRLDEEVFAWRDRSAGAYELKNAREELFSGIGSCSFTEPAEDLERLKML